MSFDELCDLTKVFPLKDILTNAGYKYGGVYLVINPDYLKHLDLLFTDENFDGIKGRVIVDTVLGCATSIDRDTYVKSNELKNLYFGTSGMVSDEEMAYNMVTNLLPASMQKVYISQYGSEEDKKKMEDLCREVIDTYRELLTENNWASVET